MKMQINRRCRIDRKIWMVCLVMLLMVAGIFRGENMTLLSVHAAEPVTQETDAETKLQLLYVNISTALYERADEKSRVLTELSQGSLVVYIEEQGHFVKVQLQDRIGYIPKECLQVENPDESAREEMKELGEYNAAFVDELERLATEKRRSRIYGLIIILLIIALFGVGIATSFKQKKNDKSEETALEERSK